MAATSVSANERGAVRPSAAAPEDSCRQAADALPPLAPTAFPVVRDRWERLVTTAIVPAPAERVWRVAGDCTLISAKDNEIAKRADRDARQVLGAAEIDADREVLKSLFAEKYRLTDPRGDVSDRKRTIDAIRAGRIRRRDIGRAGFLTTEESLQLHGNTAVSTGSFRMRGTRLAKNTKTGELAQHSLSGEYRTSHTYVQDGRWQLAASQLTRVSSRRQLVFVDD